MKKKVFVYGKFNVLHSGHVRLLRFAKELGNHLIVGIEGDKVPGSESIVSENLRLEAVKTNSFVDESFVVNEPIENVIRKIKPDIVVKGKEHQFRKNPEKNILKEYGGKLVFGSGESIYSSIDLVQKELKIFSGKVLKANDYLIRHEISEEKLKSTVKKFKNLNLAIIGDLIVDEYITCDPIGMSQEDPTMVVTPVNKIRFVGGSGIVAKHAANFGAKVNLFTVVGNDETGKFVKEDLNSYTNLRTELFVDENRPTTLKQRFRSKGQSLLRVSHLHKDSISAELQKKILDSISKIIKKLDLLVFSDFNYGCLPQNLVDKIISLAKSNNVYLVADSQASSQISNICRFKDVDLLTPTEHEARISIRDQECGLVVLAEAIRREASSSKVLLKLGAEGLLIHSADKTKSTWETDRINALNQNPKDVAGAGDCLLIISAMALSSKSSIWEAAYLGSLASALQVGRVGNIPLNIEELLKQI